MGFKKAIQSAILKSLGLSQAAQLWLNGGDAEDKTPDRPNQPYKQVDIVFACVGKLIKAVTALPLILSTIDEKIIESGPVYDLLFNSKPTFQDLITQVVGHYALTGDVFLVFVETAGTRPKKIQVVSGSQMHPVTTDGTANGELVGWEYRAGNYHRRLSLLEVHQIKNFNPYNKFHGLGPIDAARLAISQSYQSALFNETSLANGAEPGIILMLDGNPDADKARILRQQFDSRHKGANKAKRTAALAGVKDVKAVTMSMVDMQIAELRDLSDKRICSAFGVPPAVVGLSTEAQYSHGPAQQDFAVNTVIPLAALIADSITTGIISKFSPDQSRGVSTDRAKNLYIRGKAYLKTNIGYRKAAHKAINQQVAIFAWFDTDTNPAIQEMRRDIAEKVLKYRDAGIPLNDLIVVHDLPYQQTPWGDEWWIGMGQVPASYTLDAGPEEAADNSLPEGGDEPDNEDEEKIAKTKLLEKADEAQRLRIWNNWKMSWAGIEREYQEAMRKLFYRQQRELTAALKAALPDNKSIVKSETDDIVARIVLDPKKENGKIKVINQTFFDKSSELGIRQIASELGITGAELDQFVETTKRNRAIRHALNVQSQNIKSVNKTTQKKIASQMRTGLEKGEGLKDLTKRINNVLGDNRKRAQSIARTQTSGAVGAGRHTGMKQAGIELKIWLTSGDTNVRNTHKEAGRLYKKGIKIDEPFVVGGDFLMHPGDPDGTPANTINCRCVELAAKGKGKELTLQNYDNIKFYSYEDLIREAENG